MLAAMRAHRKDAIVQSTVCSALSTFAESDDAKIPAKIVAEGGIEAIKDAMLRHKKDGAVQEAGRSALEILEETKEPEEPAAGGRDSDSVKESESDSDSVRGSGGLRVPAIP